MRKENRSNSKNWVYESKCINVTVNSVVVIFLLSTLWQLDSLRHTVLGRSEICEEISTKDYLKKNLPSSGVTGTIWKELRYNKVLGNINFYLYFLVANVSIPLLLLLYHPLLSPKPQLFGLPMRRGISDSLWILQTFSATLGLLSYPSICTKQLLDSQPLCPGPINCKSFY